MRLTTHQIPREGSPVEGHNTNSNAKNWRMLKVEFDSGADLVDYVEENNLHYHDEEIEKGTQKTGRGQRRTKWAYGKLETRKRSIAQIREGKVLDETFFDELTKWRKEYTTENAQHFQGKARTARRKRRISDEGDEVSISRYLSGVPEHWSRMEKGARRRKVKLGINGSVSWQNDELSFLKTVALGAVTAEALERRGHAVEVYYISCAHNYQRNLNDEGAILFPVKKAQERFDIHRIGSIHATALLRDFTFCIQDHLPEVDDKFNGATSGMGSNQETTEPMLNFLKLDFVIELAHTEDSQEFLQHVLGH